MIEHTEIRRRLSDFLDDAVTEKERAVIESHLAECGQCRKALAELRKTVALMKTLPEVEPPPWLAAKIMAQVRDEAPRPSLWRRLFWPLHVKLPVEAFALLFICVMGYSLARNNAQWASPSAPRPGTEEAARPAEAPAAPAASAPAAPSPVAPAAPAPAAPSAPVAKNPPAPTVHLKSPSGAPRQAMPEPKPAPQSVAQEPSAAAPPLPSPAPPSVATASPAPSQRAARSHVPSYVVPPSNPLSVMGTPAPETGGSGAEGLLYETHAKKAAEQTRVRAQYEGGAREASRQNGGAAQSRQASQQNAADTEALATGMHPEESEQAGTVTAVARQEIILKVNDPAAAVDAVERAVSRCGGTIVKRSYDDFRHRLVARVASSKLSSLSRLLAKIGNVAKPPQPRAEETAVDVTISW